MTILIPLLGILYHGGLVTVFVRCDDSELAKWSLLPVGEYTIHVAVVPDVTDKAKVDDQRQNACAQHLQHNNTIQIFRVSLKFI